MDRRWCAGVVRCGSMYKTVHEVLADVRLAIPTGAEMGSFSTADRAFLPSLPPIADAGPVPSDGYRKEERNV